MPSYIDPAYMMAATKLAQARAEEHFGDDRFDVATVSLRSAVTADVSADTADGQRYDFFEESSDFETLNPDFQLIRNRSSEQAFYHNLVAIGLEVLSTPEQSVADAAAQQIQGVVNDGYTEIVVGQTKLVHVNNGVIGYGGARREVREGTVDIIGGIQQGCLHPLAGLLHLAPGEALKAATYIDGSRWDGLSMTTDFRLALHILDIVCFR